MEAIGTLSGGIAHDFNNMLAVILGNAQLARMDMELEDPMHETFQEIEDAAERAKDLTMKLLTYARKEKINIRTVSVNGTLGELVELLNRSIPKNIQIKTKLAEKLPDVTVDTAQMQQVFLNICNNACEAMPDGGTLTIESALVSLDEEYAKQNIDSQE